MHYAIHRFLITWGSTSFASPRNDAASATLQPALPCARSPSQAVDNVHALRQGRRRDGERLRCGYKQYS